MTQRFVQISMLAAMLSAVGCATTPPVENFPAGANPGEEIQKLEADINNAAAQQLDVMSPENYENAMEALRDAKEELADNDDPQDILEEVAEARAYFNRAVEFGKVAADTMPDVATARSLALKEGAKESYGKEFRKADDDLKDVTEAIEKNNVSKAQKERGELQAAFLKLELDAIQRNNLAEAKGIVKDAIRADAKDKAPQTLAKAEKSIDDAEAYIIANRHDTAKIKELSDKALNDSRQSLKIAQMVGTGNYTEASALQMEAANQAVAQKATELSEAQAALNKTAAEASAAQAAIDAQKAVDAKYEQARSMFNEDEAEVYRQGKNIVIRLRALEFDTAKSQLKGSSFPLLSKVNNVIAEFPKSTVTVEGHTDSKGGKKINEKVSQARADAVKSYFESNSKAEGARYSAVGLDFQKPLADNKTEAGRAQNRRVDIIIAPEGQPAAQ